ncbi:acyltransferase family protein [Vagococcus fluvialis]|uniref:acyltransferase family protein n=1 Tax=Vagococcus fluvialis TaxID=2738 RepID=UPI003D0EFA0D
MRKHKLKKNINIELIRIISMIMIVFHHFSIHSKWILPEDLGYRKYSILMVGSFGKIGVLLFILITGYFYANQSNHKSKLIKLNNQVTFYSLTIFFVASFFMPFSFKTLISALFPIIFEQYWFVTGYLILLLFAPILQPFLINTERRKKLTFISIIIICMYTPTIFGIIFQMNNVIKPQIYLVFLLVALCGDLIKEYRVELKMNYSKLVFIVFGFTLILILSKPFIINYLDSHSYIYPYYLITGTESFVGLLFSITFFIIILHINVPSKFRKIILFFSSVTFDVYLIHDNKILRPFIWTMLFDNNEFYWSNILPLVILFEPLIVFVICALLARTKNFFNNILKKQLLSKK